MKKINKIFALTLIAALMLTLSACGKDKENQNSKPDDTSKPTVSTPSDNNTTTESKPEENKQEESKPESKPEESKPDPKPVKKTPAELIVGKWKGQTDVAPDLADLGYVVPNTLLIELETEFTSSGSLIEKANEKQFSQAMQVILKHTIDQYRIENNISVEDYEAQIGMSINEYIEILSEESVNSYTITAEYQFVNDTLLVKFGELPFMKTGYEFIDDDTLRIYTDSDETIYFRVK